jgi:hypothetical protein
MTSGGISVGTAFHLSADVDADPYADPSLDIWAVIGLANKRDSCEYLLLGSFQGFLGKEKQIMYGTEVFSRGIIDVKVTATSKSVVTDLYSVVLLVSCLFCFCFVFFFLLLKKKK